MKKLFLYTFASVLALSPAFAEEKKEAKVARSQFTSAVVDREPSDNLGDKVAHDKHENIFFFTEIRDAEGTEAKHVWKKGDAEVYTHTFTINGPRWRVNSSVKANHAAKGETLSVATEVNGTTLDTKEITFE